MAQANTAAPARKLPGSLETNRRLDRWLSINADGTVTLYTGKVEIGQGILTAVMQMTAEELDIDVSRIRLKAASTAFSPDEGITSGSRSIQESGLAHCAMSPLKRATCLLDPRRTESSASRWKA